LAFAPGAPQPRDSRSEQPLANIGQMDPATARGQVLGVVANSYADLGHERAGRNPAIQKSLGDRELHWAVFGEPDVFKIKTEPV
jgi:hypothetical protein